MDKVKEQRVPGRSAHVVYSATGELITSGCGLYDVNPCPDASAPSRPYGASERVFFDITCR